MAKNIAVFGANFSHLFPSQVLLHIEKEAAGLGFNTSKYSTSGVKETEDSKFSKLLEKEPPAAVIAVCMKPSLAVLKAYAAAGIPVVIIEEECEGVTTVAGDSYIGGIMAGEYLAKAGKKKPAIITGKINIAGDYNARLRLAGFTRAFEAHGIAIAKENTIQVVNYSYNEGADAAELLMVKGVELKADAVFCAAGDMCALGLLKGLRELGVKVPEDMAVMGYDDIEQAATSRPALTTIKQPYSEIGYKAVKAAVDRIKNKGMAPEKILIKPELVIRKSA